MFGAGVVEEKWDDVAAAHLQNYINKIKENDDIGARNELLSLPDTLFIEESYAQALIDNGLSKDGAIDLALNQIDGTSITVSLGAFIDEYFIGGEKAGFDLNIPMPDWHQILEFAYGDFGDRTHEDSGNFTDQSFSEALQNLGIAGILGTIDYLRNIASDLPDYINKEIDEFGDALQALIEDYAWALGQLADYIKEIAEKFGAAIANSSPLILDLSGNGTIDLISLQGSGSSWDNNADGFRTASGWVDSADGLLAIDLNENGFIDDNSELFGTMSTDGFTILAHKDSNYDGQITAEDAVWENLIIWQDTNENGYSDTGELYAMGHFDIVSINLDAAQVSQTNQGHAVTHTSTFIVDDGVSPPETRIISDVWFQHDAVNSSFASVFAPDPQAFFLPTLRGYGTIPDLHIAMSLDNAEAGNLLSLVEEIHSKTFAQTFDATGALTDDVRAIMFRWAGVDEIDPGSRGPYIDARELAFLEKLMGQAFLQRGHWSNPAVFAGYDLQEAFHIALNNVYARLAAQSAGGELFEGNWFYNVATDAFEGVTGLNQGRLDALETEAAALSTRAARQDFWENVVRMVEFSVSTANLSAPELAALQAAIADSDIGSATKLDLEDDILPALAFTQPAGINRTGTSGADTINGSSGDDTLTGAAGNDTLNGLAGNDRLEGQSGADTLRGGTGGDYLLGGFGSDVYAYNPGDGFDTIREQGTGTGDGNERIVFGAGITLANLTFTRVGNTDLLIDINVPGQLAQIIIEDQFNYASGGGHVESLRFSGGGSFDLDGQNWTTRGTAAADTIYGVRNGAGGLGADTIYGYGGNDTLYAYAPNGSAETLANILYGGDGDDALYAGAGADMLYGEQGNDRLDGGSGNDILVGGPGNDQVTGGAGDDEYRYLSGQDVYGDASGIDTIRLDAIWNGITPWYFKIGNDFQIYFDQDNTITITNFYAAGNAIETLIYANAVSVALTSLTARLQGTGANDSLTGTTGADILFGFGGNDTLNGSGGSNGNDRLYGGAGNDRLRGGYGNDYLDGGAGNDTLSGGNDNDTYFYVSGHDIFDDISGTEIVEMAAGWTRDDLTLRRYATDLSDLVIEINAVNSITLRDQFQSIARGFDTLRLHDGSGDITLASLQYETHGGTGNDNLNGILVGGSIQDIIYGFAGNDDIDGDSGDDLLYGGDGNDILDGGYDNDTLYGEAGNDTLYGSAGNDTFVYSAGLDVLNDTSGADILKVTGSKTINDITLSDLGTTGAKIVLSAGVNEITVNGLRGSVSQRIETITFDDGFSADLPSYKSWIGGTSAANTLNGGTTNDTLIGKGGNDTLNGNAGNDAIHGGTGNDIIRGGDGNDTLHGGDGTDTLYGDAGDDVLLGWKGIDTLYGGAGADKFVFQKASAFSGVDKVMDFSKTQNDKLDLSDVLDFTPGTHAITDFVQITTSGANSILKIDADGTANGVSFVQIATLQNVTGLNDEAALVTGGYLLA